MSDVAGWEPLGALPTQAEQARPEHPSNHASEAMDRLGERVEHGLTITEEPVSKVPASAVSHAAAGAGLVEVTVVDGLVRTLSVDPDWVAGDPEQALRETVRALNDALRRNQEAVLEEAAKVAPSAAALRDLIRQTSTDFAYAFENVRERA